jgi:aspartate racemase
LLKVADDEHIFSIVLHHIACDGWSLEVLLRELSRLYEVFELGRPSPLPELPLQFADFAQWQQATFTGDTLSRQRDYWMKQLGNAPAVLGFPTDYPRPAMQTFSGSREELPLPRSLVDALSETGRRDGATLYMTTLAALQALLFRYTGRNDIVVGSPVAGRDRVETEKLVGCFINTIVLRADLNGDLSFRALLQRVREVTVDAFTHQVFPFERLLEELQPARNPSYSPLFQVLFALENLPRPCLSLPELRTERIDSESGTAQFDVAVSLRSRDDGSMRVVFEYNTDLFRPATVSAMLEHYRLLLKGVASNPDCRITDLPLPTAHSDPLRGPASH